MFLEMIRSSFVIFAIFSIFAVVYNNVVQCLDNGLALTPPMGWMAWDAFRCNIDCENHPDTCVSEKLITDMTDKFVTDGYKDAGYEYVNIDDCWSSMSRDEYDKLVADPIRFPHGIKWLANYVHSKGLKFGLYGDYGVRTCAKYPGSMDYLEIDAKTIASWDVDSWKMDGCNSNFESMSEGYPAFARYLKETHRPILFSCSWPFYTHFIKHIPTDFNLVASSCNTFRVFNDIQDNWASLLSVISYMFDNQDLYQPLSGPGHFADADQIFCGQPGTTLNECKSQFSIWAILASPLYLSTDLRVLEEKYKHIVLNKEIIAVNQDKLGIAGRRVFGSNKTAIEVYTRPLSNGDFAVVVFNKRDHQHTFELKQSLLNLSDNDYIWRDLFELHDVVLNQHSKSLNVVVDAHSSSMYRLTKQNNNVNSNNHVELLKQRVMSDAQN